MIRGIVTDIEGTTSAISFVYGVLFPFARARLADYVHAHEHAPEVREQIDAVGQEVGRPLSTDEAIAQLLRWMNEDRKVTPLKTLQGMIWEEGFQSGQIQGHVYEDAVRRLREWRQQGLSLFVYSSGSVQAQRLLFGHSVAGDLTPLFSGYFDTRIGAKREAESYRTIARAVGMPPGDLLFLSDVPEELDAAREAGFETAWIIRDQTPDPTSRHPEYADFDALRIEPVGRVGGRSPTARPAPT